MAATHDVTFQASASIAGRRLSDRDIRDAELERARHALAYLKHKLGNEAMRALLGDDLDAMGATVRGWVEASRGEWRAASLELSVPGPSAREFQDWYVDAMTGAQEAALRAGHPEHFVSHPLPGRVEVVENIGETELPWRVFYSSLPEDFAFPIPWEAGYALRHGMEILDVDGLRVGFSMRQSLDAEDGLRLKFTTLLPSAASPDLAQRHLTHFAIEFRNWTRVALAERDGRASRAEKP